MKKSKTVCMAALTAVLALSLAACSKNEGKVPSSENNAPVQNENNTPDAGDSEEPDAAIQQGTGIYTGQIDPSSIEIRTKDGPAAFRLGEGMEETIKGLNEGDTVSFEYKEKAVEGDDSVQQLILVKLEKADAGGAGAEGSEQSAGGELPETKAFKIEFEGDEEMRTAKLVQGSGYSLYVFEQFTFDAEAGKLAMKIDENFFVEIKKLPSDYNLGMLQVEGKEELSAAGEVRELKGEEIQESMRDAELYLVSRGSNVTKEYIVKEIGGSGYSFKVNIPHSEPMAGFGPLAFTSMDSIVNQE